MSTSRPGGVSDTNSLAAVDDTSAAVVVRKAYKEYRSKSLFRRAAGNMVIRGLDMTVRRGTIYGLLGASGCGKTTLIRSIVGRDQLTSGVIRTLGGTPGAPGSGVPGPAVGYMPQELSLYSGFSIGETFRYFGWLTGVQNEELAERTSGLLEFLDLPPSHCMVGELSGGQQRRVSFAVALLHRPPLLILDEPTVGVDSVLRQRLWDHLLDISADGRTAVIITTHYIEEARQAHTLGLMRQGVLLAEDAPDRILERHRCGSIEQVFLKLSRAQAGATTHREADVTAPAVPAAGRQPATPVTEAVTTRRQPCETQSVTDAPFAQNKPSSTSNITCLLWKHALWMRRNPLMLAFLLLLPLVSSMLFGSTVGRDPKQLKVAVVNDESGRCMDSAHARLDSFNCSSPTHLSCRFVTMLMDLDFDPVFYGTVHDAKGAVQTGKAWSAIHFPANFTDSVIVRYNDGRLASNETLVNSEVSVWLDNSNSYLSAVMRSGMTSGTMDLLQQMLDRCDFGTALAGVFVQFEAPIYGVADVQFLDFAAPGFALTIIFSIPLASAAGVILYEKNDGILNRSLVLGMTMRDVLLSHIITQAVLMVPVITVVLVSFLDLVKIHNNGPLEWVVLLCVLQGFCGLCLGMLVSSLADSDQGATYVAFAFFFPFVVLSGIMWPVEGMHPALRSMSYALPLTLPSTSLRYMMSRGWGPNHADVIYGFLSTGVWIIILLTSVMFVRSNKR